MGRKSSAWKRHQHTRHDQGDSSGTKAKGYSGEFEGAATSKRSGADNYKNSLNNKKNDGPGLER